MLPVGPVDILIVGFPTTVFDGSMAPALTELVASGTVRLLDLLVVAKELDGTLSYLEISEAGEAVAADVLALAGDEPGLLAEDDVAAVADGLAPGTSAALIVWENTWALRAVQSVAGNGGVVIAHERVSAVEVAAALEGASL